MERLFSSSRVPLIVPGFPRPEIPAFLVCIYGSPFFLVALPLLRRVGSTLLSGHFIYPGVRASATLVLFPTSSSAGCFPSYALS